MSFSLFSKQKSTDKKNVTSDQEISNGVRTMRDDLLEIKNKGKGKIISTPKNSEEIKGGPVDMPIQGVQSKQVVNPFSKEAEKVYETEIDLSDKKVIRPIPAEIVIKQEEFIPKKTEQEIVKKNPAPIVPTPSAIDQQPQEKSNLFVIVSIVIITIVLISAGTYYYLFVIKKKVTPPPVAPPEQVAEPIVPKTVVPPPVKELPYALDKPNYLSINTDAISLEDIQKTFSTNATRIKEASIAKPVEFLITDQNNNPIIFSRFATLMKIDLPPAVLSRISDTFSLYIYNDSGFMRIGLNLALTVNEGTLPAITKIEGTLPSIFQTLMLEPNITVPKTIAFKSNIYTPVTPSDLGGSKKQPVALRYANMDIPKKVSIDYAVVGSNWYIGTSRGTLTALLDVNIK